MLLVGELINSSRSSVKTAIDERDIAFFQNLAVKQVEAGAAYVDVNCGTQVFDEEDAMEWLVKSIQQACDAPLCIDTPSEKALAAGLEAAKGNGKQQMLNSITGERARYSAVLPLVQQYRTKVVALCMDDGGVPETAADRIRVLDQLVANLSRDGVDEDQIYLDPLIKPISTGDNSGLEVLETLRHIRETYPKLHAICGLSNISYGLPNRKVLNRAFMIQTMAMGMDAFILDPLDRELMGAFFASQALLGQDEFCAKFLAAHRQGIY